MVIYNPLPNNEPRSKNRMTLGEHIDHSMPWEYFNGSAKNDRCGGGAVLYLNHDHHFKIKCGLGPCTNNSPELYNLKLLLLFALEKGCRLLQIFGDSKVIFDCFSQNSTCHMHTLINILDNVLFIKGQFDLITSHHIYRERNTISDQLSKEGM